MHFKLIFLSLLPLTLAMDEPGMHAAECLALKKGCSPDIDSQAPGCRAGIWAKNQSAECKSLACEWCALSENTAEYPCTERPLRRICSVDSNVEPEATEPPSKDGAESAPAENGKCTWRGDDEVVIDFGVLPPTDGWTRVSREGYKGLVFEKEKTNGIVAAGTRGKMCFSVELGRSGYYLLTALTAAPHHTEHNDMWVSSSLGFKLLKEGRFDSVGAGVWTKAYQNEGGLELADYLRTVDHNGHSFVLEDVREGVPFEICVSGRSYQFEVFGVALIGCGGVDCRMNGLREEFGGWEGSRCE